MNIPKINPYKTCLDQGNAYWMARISKEVYKKTNENDDSPAEDEILRSLSADNPGFLSVKGKSKSSAQAALIEHKDYLCMAFRGTDEVLDWLDNMNVLREEVLFGEFHKGFWKSVEDVWSAMNSRCRALLREKKRPVFFTGHSLGGAMATIAAAIYIDQDLPFTSVYTFGQPRAMNRPTARIYNLEAKSRHHRFVNNEDIVTRVPTRLAGHSHVGNCIYIDNDGIMHKELGFWNRFLDTVQGAAESMVEKGLPSLISDHNVECYLSAIEAWELDD